MRKTKTPRKRTFFFGGTRVIVVAEILNKWDKLFPGEQKIALHDTADAAIMNRLVEKPWRRECDLYESIDLAYDAIRRLFKTYRTPSDKREIIPSGLEKDPVKLRDAAKALKRAAKELCRRADTIETPFSGYNPIPELQSILGHHWSHPSGICLYWMSYPALAKFLSLTVPSLESLTAAALEKECQRLGLRKMSHPLVEQDQVYRVGNTVHIAGSSYHRAVNR
jgi:hypothetical protein